MRNEPTNATAANPAAGITTEGASRGLVAVALHEAALGGASRSVLRAVPHLEELGWRFVFWAPKPSDAADQIEGMGYEVDGAPRYIEYTRRSWLLPPGPRRRIASVPGYLRAYRRFLSDRRPDVVHANSMMLFAEGLVAKREGHNVVLHLHEMLPNDLRGRATRWVVWKWLDEIVAVSQASASLISLPGRTPRIAYEAAPIPKEPVEIREDPDPFTIGTIAVVSVRKGSDTFVEACALLRDRMPGLRFEMIGAPNEAHEKEWAQNVLARAAALGVRHVRQADVSEVLKRWDAFVLPSRGDPFPLAMLEAMAAGLPVIGTDVDGIAEQVANGCGLKVPVSDPGALADAMGRMAASSRSERKAMGEAARRRVTENFSIAHQASELDAAYRAAMG